MNSSVKYNFAVISGIINKNPNCEAVEVVRENGINNVVISNTVTKAKIK